MTEMEQIDSGNTKFRVKIYEGTDSGNWVDKGTGHVFTTFSVILALGILECRRARALELWNYAD